MDAHIQDVAVLVLEADGLLLLAVDVQLLQAAELADAVVDVHHVVARLEQGEFLERERFLVALEAFFEAEAVVALKNLVVGVAEQFFVRVHKALAELDDHGGELHVALLVLKDVVQPLDLLGLVGGDHVGVAFASVGVEVGGQQVKILGKGRLGLHVEGNAFALHKGLVAAKFHHAEVLQQAVPILGGGVELLWRQVAGLAGELFELAAGTFHFLVEVSGAAFGVHSPHHGVAGQEFQNGLAAFLQEFFAHVRHDGGLGHGVDTQLVDRVKLADAFHLVAKKLDAVRVIKAEGEHVHDAAAHAVLAGLKHVVHLLKAKLLEGLVDEFHVEGVADFQVEGVLAELAAGDHFFSQGFRKRDDDGDVAPFVDLVEHLGAHGNIGVLGLLLLVRYAGRTRVKQRLGLVQHAFEVVHEIRRGFLVLQYNQVAALALGNHARSNHGTRRTNGALQVHFGTWARQALHQALGLGVQCVPVSEFRRGHRRDGKNNRSLP